MTKRCRQCKRERPLDQFPKDRSKRDGHASRCKDCDRAKSKAQYARHVEERRAKARERSQEARMGNVRLCRKCGEPATSARHHYCDTCRPPAKHRHVAKTAARGYGHQHTKERKKVAKEVAAGTALCARCGGHIEPGAEWHLDHSDDRMTYLGPSHADCNVKAVQQPRRRARRRSRDW